MSDLDRDPPPIFDRWGELLSWSLLTPEQHDAWWRLEAEITKLVLDQEQQQRGGDQ